MKLSSDLLNKFAKITKDKTPEKQETIAYGTIVKSNDSTFVKLDGSDILTPVSTTADTEDNERVIVQIKNHKALITGNMSSPSARSETVKDLSDRLNEFNLDHAIIVELESDNVEIKKQLSAANANITSLQTTKIDADIANAKFATIENLTATNTKLYNLESTYGDFVVLTTQNFESVNAKIEGKLSATDIEGKYANIDFSNITDATMQNFYASSGLIDNVIIQNGVVTGELQGVTISGDLINASTIVADKLVLLGNDGLYYKLNASGDKVESTQTDYNSLNGEIIKAKTITANKINVSDLSAFNATIGGFSITTNSLYSGVKNSVNNTTRGSYLDNDGQVSFGDASNYVRFYKNTDNSYKLDISASSIVFGNDKTNIETVITDINDNILAWCYNNNKTYINGSKIYAGTITSTQLSSDSIKSNNYVINQTGSFLNLSDGSFDSKYLKWNDKGEMIATSGSIGGITLNDNGLSAVGTQGEKTIGYQISKDGTIKVTNTGSGRDYVMNLNAEKLTIESVVTYSGSNPRSAILEDDSLLFKMDGSTIGYIQASNDSTLDLYGGQGIKFKSSVTSEGNFNAPNIPIAGALDDLSGSLSDYFPNDKTFIGSAYAGDTWYNVISVRHRNGAGDGNRYGMLLYSGLTGNSNLVWRQHMNNDWGNERTILDTDNINYYEGQMKAIRYNFTNDVGSFITSRTGGGFDFWFTYGGMRMVFDGTGKIYKVTADGVWTVLVE